MEAASTEAASTKVSRLGVSPRPVAQADALTAMRMHRYRDVIFTLTRFQLGGALSHPWLFQQIPFPSGQGMQ
jgi:hypothetical protein